MSSYTRRDREFEKKVAAKVPVAHWAYRLFHDHNGQPKTLYHTHKGSSILPLDAWLHSTPKTVFNPGKRTTGGKGFKAGFHVFPTVNELIKYSKTMDDAYAVVAVMVRGSIRPKPRSRSTVQLAEDMMIPSIEWGNRIPLECFKDFGSILGMIL